MADEVIGCLAVISLVASFFGHFLLVACCTCTGTNILVISLIYEIQRFISESSLNDQSASCAGAVLRIAVLCCAVLLGEELGGRRNCANHHVGNSE